jgi:hypothetical protein
MSKMNLLVHLNAYQDVNATVNPSQNNWKWQRDIQGISIADPSSKSLSLPSGQSLSLFSGMVATSDDTTTTWNIALKAGTSQTYKISKASGTSPAFRAARVSGADATTQISITKNATLLTISSTAGTPLNLIVGSVVVGDEVRLGTLFNPLNQGKYKILARTANSFTIENPSGSVEGSITLGTGFADQLSIFSATGVQVADKVDIIAGFSSVSFGTYEITDVSPDYIEIHCTSALPSESGVVNTTPALLIYNNAKSFVYIESDKKLEVKVNNSVTPNSIQPMLVGTSQMPGVFMSSSSMKSITITNTSLDAATIFYVTAV